ncbi:CopG family transcriptional regulator [Duganella sp. FT80W]|uniref:CopG family transcriptional regulator n=1 Tax=Duganella guangzhouensis TaxID=2666084 RepID=A0A6I2L0P8_9BURK|nr:CopG family transcriptional regulator [Duganella guangzhouensis]MRW91768.1 CopG family transcriptional regulator [Duganella guangzhouensis]
MTVAEIEAAIRLLSAEEKQHLLELLLDDGAAAQKDQLTREALDDVDAGRLVEHDDVKAWADSLEANHPCPQPR